MTSLDHRSGICKPRGGNLHTPAPRLAMPSPLRLPRPTPDGFESGEARCRANVAQPSAAPDDAFRALWFQVTFRSGFLPQDVNPEACERVRQGPIPGSFSTQSHKRSPSVFKNAMIWPLDDVRFSLTEDP